jgi:hypothetical protein
MASPDTIETVVLYRPVGPTELALIEAASYRAFPPRLPDQPIFYPVTTEAYAVKIARDWNTKFHSGREGEKRGYVTRFAVAKAFLDRYQLQLAGGRAHEEYWIPADELSGFNAQIVGRIEVIAEFSEVDRLAFEQQSRT